MERSELARIVRSVPVFFGDDRVVLECDFGKLTPELLQSASTISDWESTVAFLSELVIGWDVTDKGKPYPFNREALLGLPAAIVTQMITTVVTHCAEQSTGTPSCMRSLLGS